MKIVVAVNFTDEPGQDGDWIEAPDGVAAMMQARVGLLACGFPADGMDDIMRKYEVVDLCPTEVQEINGASWCDLSRQWKLSKRNGWTSDQADRIMTDEIKRREMMD